MSAPCERVTWNALKTDTLFLVIAEKYDGQWHFWTRSTWDIAWYRLPSSAEYITRAEAELRACCSKRRGSVWNLARIFLPTFWASVRASLSRALRMASWVEVHPKKVIHFQQRESALSNSADSSPGRELPVMRSIVS
jgi:hypothetical protein